MKKAIALAEANPSFLIYFAVDGDELVEYEGWTAHEICRVEVVPWYRYADRIMIDEDEILEFLEDLVIEQSDPEDVEQEVNFWYNEQVKQVILISTTAARGI
jgi:hypothetical protein